MHRVLHEGLEAVFVNLLRPVVGREYFLLDQVVEAEYRKIKRPFSPLAVPTQSSTPRHRERPQRARGSPWPRQRRPPGVGQPALGLPGGLLQTLKRGAVSAVLGATWQG